MEAGGESLKPNLTPTSPPSETGARPPEQVKPAADKQPAAPAAPETDPSLATKQELGALDQIERTLGGPIPDDATADTLRTQLVSEHRWDNNDYTDELIAEALRTREEQVVSGNGDIDEDAASAEKTDSSESADVRNGKRQDLMDKEEEGSKEISLKEKVEEAWTGEDGAVWMATRVLGEEQGGIFSANTPEQIADNLGIDISDPSQLALIESAIQAVNNLWLMNNIQPDVHGLYPTTTPSGEERMLRRQDTIEPILNLIKLIGQETTEADGETYPTHRALRAQQVLDVLEPTLRADENGGYYFHTKEAIPQTEQEMAEEKIEQYSHNFLNILLRPADHMEQTEIEAIAANPDIAGLAIYIDALEQATGPQRSFLLSGIHERLRDIYNRRQDPHVSSFLGPNLESDLYEFLQDQSISSEVEKINAQFLRGNVHRILYQHYGNEWATLAVDLQSQHIHRNLSLAARFIGLSPEDISKNLNQLAKEHGWGFSTGDVAMIRAFSHKDHGAQILETILENAGLGRDVLDDPVEYLKTHADRIVEKVAVDEDRAQEEWEIKLKGKRISALNHYGDISTELLKSRKLLSTKNLIAIGVLAIMLPNITGLLSLSGDEQQPGG